MNSRKVFYVMLGILGLLVVVLGISVVLGNSYLQRQSDKLLEAKLNTESLQEQQTALIKAEKDLETYSDLQQIAKSIVPQDKDQARAVREIVRLASESGVTLESITFDDSSLGQAPAAPNAPPENGQPVTPQPSSPNTPVTQAQPVEGIQGVYRLPIEITSTKNNNQYNNFISFLSRLENNRRTAQVEKISIIPGQTPGGQGYINFSLTVNIFVKP